MEKTMKNILLFITLAAAMLNAQGMVKIPVAQEDLSEVFTNERLNAEFYAKKFLLMEAVIQQRTPAVEAILKKSHPKVAVVLANHIHQHCTHAEKATPQAGQEASPLQRTINPFFEKLTSQQRNDLDVATPLNVAAFLNDMPTLKALLAEGARINAGHGIDGYTPLHIAVKYNPDIIPFLISAGADVENRAHFGSTTPLMLACQKDGAVKAIRPLLQAGASFAAKTQHLTRTLELTPLHIACNNGEYEKAETLLHHGAPVDGPDNEGATPLQWAVTTPHTNCVKLLLENGADCKKLTSDGISMIDLIQKSYAWDIALKLFQYGAPYPKTPQGQELIEKGLEYLLLLKSTFYKNLINTIVHENQDALNQLLPHATGDQLNEVDDRGMTPLIWATVRGNAHAVRALLAPPSGSLGTSVLRVLGSSKANLVNIDHKDKTERTAFDWADRLGNNEIKQMLLAHKSRA